MSEQTVSLPAVATISIGAPFKWLAGAWQDYLKAPVPFMLYGIMLSAVSAMIAWALVFSGAFAWVFVLAGGFFLIAPILAMGLYEGGRMLERGETPGLTDIILVRGAVVMRDHRHPEIAFTAPAGGRISRIRRGARRPFRPCGDLRRPGLDVKS